MPDITGQLLIDLDDSGAFATNLCAADGDFTSGFWKVEPGFLLRGRGRSDELDEAGMASFTLSLDNADGRFSPQNSLSPYQVGFVNQFRPYKQAHVKLIFNAVTYDMIKGVITDIKIGPEAGDQLCEITIRDYMFVLSRTEIRRPLMLNQYTGVIIHRLLDDVEGAEDREEVANPAFAQNLTGWSAQSGATITRMTGDDKGLEGPGSMRVVTGATGFTRYTFPNDLAGLVYTGTVYVKPEADEDIGDQVRIVLGDNVGSSAGSFTALANRDQWTRLSITRTFNAGSTSQHMQIESIAGNISYRVGAGHCVPFVNAMARDIDEGKSFLEKYTYHRGAALTAVQEVRENELGGLFFFSGDGTAVFQDRHYRFPLTSQGTFDERGRLDYEESGDDRIKAVILDYPHFVDGTPGTVVWETDRVIPLPIGLTWRVEADYQGGVVRDTIIPVANTDYTINAAGDGTGIDMSGSVTFTFDDFGGGSAGYFTNNATKIVYLRTYRVRGTPVKLAEHKTPARYTPAGGPALAATLSYDYGLNGSEPSVQAWAEYLGDRYSEQRPRLTLHLSAPFPEAAVATTDMVQILARGISDKVQVVNDTLPFATDVNDLFHIDSIELRLQSDGKIHSLHATWRLSGKDEPYYVIGDTIAGQLVAP
jgi:hypothetical protein